MTVVEQILYSDPVPSIAHKLLFILYKKYHNDSWQNCLVFEIVVTT